MKRSADIRIQVVGRGRLGTTLAAALHAAEYRVLSTGEPTDGADLVFLCVPDGAIRDVCEGMGWHRGQFAVHCSGALGLDVLSAAADKGAVTGCWHPIESFPTRRPEPDRFEGITCGIEAAEPLSTLLEEIARRLGSRTIRLEGVDRRLYHAAAVFVSNYLVALMHAGIRAWELAGLPAEEALPALEPLMVSTASNIGRFGLLGALTGPIARGDAGTVSRHLEALGNDASLEGLYRGLGGELLQMLWPDGPPHREQLRELLEQER